MNAKELEECLLLLVGDANFKTALPQEISSDDFAEQVHFVCFSAFRGKKFEFSETKSILSVSVHAQVKKV